MAHAIKYVHTSETLRYTFDFADDLPSTDSALADVTGGPPTSTITATDFDGTDVSATILSNKTRTGKTLIVDVGSLTEGEEYTVTFKGVGATSSVPLVKLLEVRARSKIVGGF